VGIVTNPTYNRARAGDERAFRELIDPYRRELQLHCYRILGSVQDAEDAVQETLMAAWRSLDGFQARSSFRTWLYRIATNRCFDMLRVSARRPPLAASPALLASELPEPTDRLEASWVQPYPDVLLDELADDSTAPDARYDVRESVELAFIIALQHLPLRQRATLILRDVLGFRSAEVAELLQTTTASVNSALRRARAALDKRVPTGEDRAPEPGGQRERDLVARFATAFQDGEVDKVIALLTADARFSMPPEPFEYRGLDAISRILTNRFTWRGEAHLRLVSTRANTQAAFGCYLQDPHTPIARAHGLLVLTLRGDRISGITRFLDNSILPAFGLPRTLTD
jgi:RNA polymerase sigma-70 factor (TIGR02960 family)